jgi:hypothetical protein
LYGISVVSQDLWVDTVGIGDVVDAGHEIFLLARVDLSPFVADGEVESATFHIAHKIFETVFWFAVLVHTVYLFYRSRRAAPKPLRGWSA